MWRLQGAYLRHAFLDISAIPAPGTRHPAWRHAPRMAQPNIPGEVVARLRTTSGVRFGWGISFPACRHVPAWRNTGLRTAAIPCRGLRLPRRSTAPLHCAPSKPAPLHCVAPTAPPRSLHLSTASLPLHRLEACAAPLRPLEACTSPLRRSHCAASKPAPLHCAATLRCSHALPRSLCRRKRTQKRRARGHALITKKFTYYELLFHRFGGLDGAIGEGGYHDVHALKRFE